MSTTKRPRSKIPSALRASIYARDDHRCVYCGGKITLKRRPGTLDHVVPHSLGGADTAANLVTCCMACNVRRATFPVDLFAELLRREGHPGAEARVLKAISTPLPPRK